MAVASSLHITYRATSVRLGALLFLLWGTCDAWSFAPPLYHRPPFNNRHTTTTLSASISSVVDLDESTPRNVESMEEWATNYGVQYADGFALAPTAEADPDCDTIDRHDMSVVTNADLAAESPVLYVPADLILTSTAARQQLSSNGLSDALDLLARLQSSSDDDAEFCLFGKVLVEYEQGDASPWFAWLNSLPRTFYNGASMTREWFVLPRRCAGHALLQRFDSLVPFFFNFPTHPSIHHHHHYYCRYHHSLLLRMFTTTRGHTRHEGTCQIHQLF